MSNKYQYADVVSNDDSVLDVEVFRDTISVVYTPTSSNDEKLEWVGNFLEEKSFEFEETEPIKGTQAQKDVYRMVND